MHKGRNKKKVVAKVMTMMQHARKFIVQVYEDHTWKKLFYIFLFSSQISALKNTLVLNSNLFKYQFNDGFPSFFSYSNPTLCVFTK